MIHEADGGQMVQQDLLVVKNLAGDIVASQPSGQLCVKCFTFFADPVDDDDENGEPEDG